MASPLRPPGVRVRHALGYFLALTLVVGLLLGGPSVIQTWLTLAILSLALGPTVRVLVSQNADALNPSILLPLIYGTFALAPLTHGPQFSSETWTSYLAIQTLALSALRLGLWSAFPRGVLAAPQAPVATHDAWVRERSSTLFTAVVLLAAAVPSMASQVIAFGGMSGFVATGYGGERNLILESATTIGSGFDWWLLGSALLAFYGLRAGSRGVVVLGALLYAVVAALLLEVGQRNPLVNSLIFFIALYHYGFRIVRPRRLLAGLVVGVLAIHYIGLARIFLAHGLGSAISETWTVVVQNPALLGPWSVSQFKAPSESLAEILEHGGPGLQYGRSYLSALATLVPIFPRFFAHLGFNPLEWRMETFHTDAWVAGARFGFSPAAEGLVNFGIPGVAIVFYAYGYAAGWLRGRVQVHSSVTRLLLFAGALPMLMLNVPSNQAATVVYQWARAYILPFVILWVIRSMSLRRLVTRTAPAVA